VLRIMYIYSTKGQRLRLKNRDHSYGKPYTSVDLEKDTTIFYL
jgi:hypothetical protein